MVAQGIVHKLKCIYVNGEYVCVCVCDLNVMGKITSVVHSIQSDTILESIRSRIYRVQRANGFYFLLYIFHYPI